MGRLGSTPADGCAPLGEHLLGAWVIFTAGLSLGDARGSVAGVAAGDGLSLSDARASSIGRHPIDGVAVADARAAAIGQSLADGLWLGDARMSAIAQAITDGLTLSDSKLLGEILMGEILGVPDLEFAVGKPLTDGVELGDARAIAVTQAIIDGLLLGDAPARAWAAYLSQVDGISLSDAEVLLLALALTLYARSNDLTLPERGG